jgi:hypothetical protein
LGIAKSGRIKGNLCLMDSYLTRAKLLILSREFDKAKRCLQLVVEDGDRTQQALVSSEKIC